MFTVSDRDKRKVNDIMALCDFISNRRSDTPYFESQRDYLDAYYRMQSEAHIMNRAFDAEHAEDPAVVMAAQTGADVGYCRKLLKFNGNYEQAISEFNSDVDRSHYAALQWNKRLDDDLLQIKADLRTWPYERAEQDRAAIIRYITYINTGAIPK